MTRDFGYHYKLSSLSSITY